ncbi:MAG: hypothetical protein OJF50_002070 [Nitrospira sp.]|nr:hypothetical protein [Nitrospira sp.]
MSGSQYVPVVERWDHTRSRPNTPSEIEKPIHPPLLHMTL